MAQYFGWRGLVPLAAFAVTLLILVAAANVKSPGRSYDAGEVETVVETADGILLLVEVPSQRAISRVQARFIVTWKDAHSGELFLFSQVLSSRQDLLAAVASLENQFAIDIQSAMRPSRVAKSSRGGEGSTAAEGVWRVGTLGDFVELTGHKVSEPGAPGDGVDQPISTINPCLPPLSRAGGDSGSSEAVKAAWPLLRGVMEQARIRNCPGGGNPGGGNPPADDDGDPPPDCGPDECVCCPTLGARAGAEEEGCPCCGPSEEGGIPCDDENACTADDQCGHPDVPDCFGCCGLPIGCNDHDPCTTDTCDPDSGCEHMWGACESVCCTDAEDETFCCHPDMEVCCQGTFLCCDEGQTCCGEEDCCEADETCCDEKACCGPDETCCDGNCCEPGQTCVNNECCEPGNTTDMDCDGILNEEDSDIDGDNIPNHEDDDIDGDGISNGEDDDDDGDGVPDGDDPTPIGCQDSCCIGPCCGNDDPCCGSPCNDGNPCTSDQCSGGACLHDSNCGPGCCCCGENTSATASLLEVCDGCVDTGRLSGGSITLAKKAVCTGQVLTFTLAGVIDTGGTKKLNCTNVTIPPATPDYTWRIAKPNGTVATGSGNVATITTDFAGTYSCKFTASAPRECPPPPLTIGPKPAKAAKIDVIEVLNQSATPIAVGGSTPARTNVAAAIKGSGDILLQARMIPPVPASELPPNLLAWIGGNTVANNQLQRTVSKSNWAKHVVRATCSSTNYTTLVYVIGAEPTGYSPQNGVSGAHFPDNEQGYATTGLSPVDQATGRAGAGCEIQFTIRPDVLVTDANNGLFAVNSIQWDVSRDKQRKLWRKNGGMWTLNDSVESWISDDANVVDEDNNPWNGNGHLYGNDSPWFVDEVVDAWVRKLNMREWIRVGLGNQSGPNGTICSEYYYWHVFQSVTQQNGIWVSDPMYGNEIPPGNVFWGIVPLP